MNTIYSVINSEVTDIVKTKTLDIIQSAEKQSAINDTVDRFRLLRKRLTTPQDSDERYYVVQLNTYVNMKLLINRIYKKYDYKYHIPRDIFMEIKQYEQQGDFARYEMYLMEKRHGSSLAIDPGKAKREDDRY